MAFVTGSSTRSSACCARSASPTPSSATPSGTRPGARFYLGDRARARRRDTRRPRPPRPRSGAPRPTIDTSTTWCYFACQGADYAKTAAAAADPHQLRQRGRARLRHALQLRLALRRRAVLEHGRLGRRPGHAHDRSRRRAPSTRLSPRALALAQWLQVICPVEHARADPGQHAAPRLQRRGRALPRSGSASTTPLPAWCRCTTPSTRPSAPPPRQQCGRVLFNDFHVENESTDMTTGKLFPAECAAGPLTAQEKMLEFTIFDLGGCVGPVAAAALESLGPRMVGAAALLALTIIILLPAEASRFPVRAETRHSARSAGGPRRSRPLLPTARA